MQSQTAFQSITFMLCKISCKISCALKYFVFAGKKELGPDDQVKRKLSLLLLLNNWSDFTETYEGLVLSNLSFFLKLERERHTFFSFLFAPKICVHFC